MIINIDNNWRAIYAFHNFNVFILTAEIVA